MKTGYIENRETLSQFKISGGSKLHVRKKRRSSEKHYKDREILLQTGRSSCRKGRGRVAAEELRAEDAGYIDGKRGELSFELNETKKI